MFQWNKRTKKGKRAEGTWLRGEQMSWAPLRQRTIVLMELRCSPCLPALPSPPPPSVSHNCCIATDVISCFLPGSEHSVHTSLAAHCSVPATPRFAVETISTLHSSSPSHTCVTWPLNLSQYLSQIFCSSFCHVPLLLPPVPLSLCLLC